MLYNLIKSQFPDHVRAQYPAFIAFVSAYYKWLEIRFSQRLENIVDIDATTDIVYVKRTVGTTNISANPFVNEIIIGETSGAKAIVKRYTTSDNHYTFYIKYISNVKFVDDELVYVEKIEGSSISTRTIDTNCVSTVAGDFITYFRSYLDVDGIFDAVDIHTAKYLKNIKDVYSAKGSEQALVFLLNSIHNTKANILYPGDNILKSSDGRWNQDSFITIQLIYGELPENARDFFLKYETSSKRVDVTYIESIASNVYRLYFKSTTVLAAQVDQFVQFKDSSNNVICQGVIVLSPQHIVVKSYGKNWRVGQIVVIPGTIRDTLARVSQIGENGELYSLEIIECGYNHPVSQTLDISPYDIRPIINNTSLAITSDPTNPTAYNLTLNIDEHPIGISEFISFFVYDYFEEDYVVFSITEPYVENLLFIQQFNVEDTTEQPIPDYWADSRATISIEYGTIVKLAGQWDGINGQISNDQIVLQDNNYYQPFSYVIDSDINANNYIDVANAVHPSGTKMFTNTNLQTFIGFNPSGFTDNLEVTQDLLDTLYPSDHVYTEHIRNITDQFVSTDKHIVDLTRAFNDSISMSDGITFEYTVTDFVQVDDQLIKNINSFANTDSIQLSDTTNKLANFVYTDSISTNDSLDNSIEFEANEDLVTMTDNINNLMELGSYSDSVTVTDTSTQVKT